jgi:hypothetical protein
MRWKEGKKTTSATLALKALLIKVPAREMGVLVLAFFSSAIATVPPLLHTTDDEDGRRGERKEGEKDRDRDRENKRENEPNTDYNFLYSIFFLGCNFVGETPCCLIPPFITSNVSIR